MNVTITPFSAKGEIIAPPSKSFAHRLMIAAFLAGGDCLVKNVGDSEDVKATISVITALGGKVMYDGKNAFIGEINHPKEAVADCGESGSTLRFFIPVAAALGIRCRFTGKGRLLSRPIGAYNDCFNGSGAKISDHTISGKLKCGTYTIDGSLSSQFVSGLLFGLSALNGQSRIILIGKEVSGGYIDITVKTLETFGVKVVRTADGFLINGGNYAKVKEVTAEGDWSGAAFPLSLGAIKGAVTVKGLNFPSLQKDSEIVEILKKFGAKVEISDGAVTVKRGKLKAIKDINLEDVPDLAQTIAAVAAYAEGTTELHGVERLKIKESDRISAITDTLKAAEIFSEYDGETLRIKGSIPKGFKVSGGNDHRTVMSAAVLAAAAKGKSEITGAEAHKKSYVAFFDDYVKLGGKIDVDL